MVSVFYKKLANDVHILYKRDLEMASADGGGEENSTQQIGSWAGRAEGEFALKELGLVGRDARYKSCRKLQRGQSPARARGR